MDMQPLLLLITDLELFVAQVVKSILLVILLGGVLVNIKKLVKSWKTRQKYVRMGILFVLVCLVFPVFKSLRLDGALLHSSRHVIGNTVEFCQVFARGKGISFEYEIQGKTYYGCNTYHPIPIENIIVPNGKYVVRYADIAPSNGYMDFGKPAD